MNTHARSKNLIKASTENKENDINRFLSIAGFNYNFEITTGGDGDSRAILKFKLPDGTIPQQLTVLIQNLLGFVFAPEFGHFTF